MKRRPAATRRDLTGLACTVGMGLLIVLAWATLPSPATPTGAPGRLVSEAASQH
jgi:hypothetical protein